MGNGDSVVALSEDGGKTWSLSELPGWIKEVVIDPFEGTILYAGVNGVLPGEGGFYRSVSRGKEWARELRFVSLAKD